MGVCFFSDEIMKLIMGGTGPISGAISQDRGWKNFPPRHLYHDFIFKELPNPQRCMAARDSFDVDLLRGEGGHDPFSTAEFNDVFVEVYEEFAKSGFENRRAIVYHSTMSNKYRYPGCFHVVKYSGSEVPSAPNPVVERAQVVKSKKSRHRPDVFWSSLCSQHIFFHPRPRVTLSYDMGIGKILVCAMVLKEWPEMFQEPEPGEDRVMSLSGSKIKQLAEKKVTGHHALVDFFKKDLVWFTTFVSNAVKSTLDCPGWPYLSKPEDDQLKLEHRLNYCRAYAYPGPDENYLEDVHERRITEAMNQKRLVPILAALSLGMNTKGAKFLLKLRTLYDASMDQTTHSRRDSSDLTKEMTHFDYELPSSLFD